MKLVRARLDIATGLRGMVGIAIPLALGLALDQPVAGVFGAVGAVAVGFGAFQGAYRTRAAAMLAACLGVSLSLLLGTLASSSTVATTVLTAAAGFIAGLLVALGPAAAYVGLQCGIAVIFASGFPTTPRGGVGRASLALVGGLLQTMVAVSFWPLARFPAERRKLSSIYRSLAHYTDMVVGAYRRPPEPGTLADVEFIRSDPQPFAPRGATLEFQALLDQAERIYTSLAALASDPLLESDSATSADLAADGRLIAVASATLTTIATALAEARAPDPLPELWDEIGGQGGPPPVAARQALWAGLMGQLRTAYRLATMLASPPGALIPAAPTALRAPVVPPLSNALQVLHANLDIHSAPFRHSIRLAVTVAVATLIYHVVALERGYWVSIAVLLVLRPDYRDTFTRGLGWLGGTLLGAGVATSITVLLHPRPELLAALVVVLAGAAYSVFRVSYFLFTICFTGYVVFLVVFAGVPESTAITYRLVNGVIGGALALAAYSLWPTWEVRRLPAQLALLLDALDRYGTAVLEAYATPASYDATALSRARAAARMARSNAEASLERTLAEPARDRAINAARAVGIVAAIRRYALAALALHAHLEQGPATAMPDVAELTRELQSILAVLSRALATGTEPRSLPDLRSTHLALARAWSAGHSPTPDAALVLTETDLMVDGVKTVADLLRGRSLGDSR